MVFLTLFACKKTVPPQPVISVDCSKPTNKEALCKELILGKWEWARTYTYFSLPSTVTPQELGHNVQFNFKADGIVETYLDGQFRDTSSYKIVDAGISSPRDSGITYLIMQGCDFKYPNSVRFYTYTRPVALKVCDDSLYLPYEYLMSHTGNNIYHRIK